MFDKLMSKDMWTMFEVFSERENGPASLYDLMSRSIPPLAKAIGLHHLAVKVDVPKDPVHGRNRFEYTIYDDGVEGKYNLCRIFTTKVNGSVEMTATADTREASEDFEKLAKLTFMLCGRVITLDTLDNTIITDMLTGASNIIGFHKRAGVFCNNGTIDDFALFYTNIKNFKYINQKIGMQNGDDLLRTYVKRFKDTFDEQSSGIFRLGADNFVLLVKKDDVPDLIQMLKTFDVILPSGISLHVYFRAGIFLAYDGCSTGDMMNYATAAYAASKTGRFGDFVFFEQNMLEEEIHTKSVMVAFPQALRSKEFCVYYQPKVEIHGMKLVGAEALCRWIRDGKTVPPLDFIPAIERFGRIIQLDMYVLEIVCSDLRGWIDSGVNPPRVSVNISRRDLAEPDLAGRICSIADKYRIPHDMLEIELTETYGTDEFSMMTKLIKALSERGFKISIDDFGSGYSTLTMLKSIKADIIKLDRAFIKDMTSKSVTDKTILKNVVNLVNELDLDIIAEGVESRDQAEFLAEVGCPVIQGYYFDKPLPKEEFDRRLSDPEFYARREEVSKTE